MQLVQFRRLLRNIGQVLRNFLLYIDPARRKQIHLNNHVAIFFEAARLGDQATTLLRLGRIEAIGGAAKTGLFGGVVCK
jgi:hypothetical protein